MEYRVLGPLEVRDGQGSLPLAGAKQRALLALLLVHANHVLSRDRLIDELWGDEPPETAVQSLQVYVSRLRKLLPAETLLTRPPGYLLEIEPDELDLQLLRAPARRGARGARRRATRNARRLPARRARALARPGARRVRLRAVRPGRDRTARGPAPGGGRGADRGRSRARTPRRPDRRARGAGRRESLPRAAARPADARALPLGPAGRGARGLPRTHAAHSSTSSGSSRAPRCNVSRSRSSPRTRASTRRRVRDGSELGARRPRCRAQARHRPLRRPGDDERARGGPRAYRGVPRPSPRRGGGRDRSRRRHGREGHRRRAARDLRRAGRTRGGSRPPRGQRRARHAQPAERRVRRRAVAADGRRERRGDPRPTRLVRDRHACRGGGAARPLAEPGEIVVGERAATATAGAFDLQQRDGAYVLVGSARPDPIAGTDRPPTQTTPTPTPRRRAPARRRGRERGRLSPPATRRLTVPPNSVGIIDPKTNKVVGHVPVGSRPDSVAVGENGVWVANLDDKTLSRIDPETRKVARRSRSTPPRPDSPSAPESVWVAHGYSGALARVAPQYNSVSEPTSLPVRPAARRPARKRRRRRGIRLGRLRRLERVPDRSSVDARHRPSICRVRSVRDRVRHRLALGCELGRQQRHALRRVDQRRRADVRRRQPSERRRRRRRRRLGHRHRGQCRLANRPGRLWLRHPSPSGERQSASRMAPAVSGSQTAATAPSHGSIRRTSKVVATIRVGNSPLGIAVGDDGMVWVTVRST